MTSISGRTLVDTNVLFYALGGKTDPRTATARKALDDLMESGQLVLSTQVLQELFVTLTRKAGVPHERALTILDDLSAWPLFSVDFGAVREAALLSASARISFWDALVAAAARMGAEWLLSEDLNHGQMIAGVRIVNPFEPG